MSHEREETQVPLRWEETRAESCDGYSTQGRLFEGFSSSPKANNDKAQSEVACNTYSEDLVNFDHKLNGRPREGSFEKGPASFRKPIHN